MAELVIERPGALIREAPEIKALSRLRQGLNHLKERGVSLSIFREKLEDRARGKEEKDPLFKEVLAQLQAVLGQYEKREKELTPGRIPRLARETMTALAQEPLSPEEKERLKEAEIKLAEFEAKGMLGELSSNPERRVEQLGVALAGEEGRRLLRAIMAASSGEPYPMSGPPRIGGGEKGFFGTGKGPGFKKIGSFLAIPAALAVCVAIAASPIWQGRQVVSPGELEEARKREAEAALIQAGHNLLTGAHPYSWIEGSEGMGEEGRQNARTILNTAAEVIINEPDERKARNILNSIPDPIVIARLIHDYGYRRPEIFNPEVISPPERQRQVREYLQTPGYFPAYEEAHEGYQPPPRVKARLQREAARIAHRPPTRLQQIASRKAPTFQERRKV